jgi:4-azaleucine resistance transporter AzlC
MSRDPISVRAMDSPAPINSAVRDQFCLGARACVPVCISVAAYGIVWGMLAGQAGLSVLETALMSGLVFAGSAQFVALDLWSPAASLPIGAIIMAALIVNLRYILLTATLRPLYYGKSIWRGALSMFLVSDENWAMTVGAMAKGGGSPAFLMGGGVLAYVCWMAATVGGRLLGSVIDDPTRYGLDFAFTATFLALLLAMWRGKSDLVPWLVAAASAILAAHFIPGSWHILVGGLTGSFAGAMVEMRKRPS